MVSSVVRSSAGVCGRRKIMIPDDCQDFELSCSEQRCYNDAGIRWHPIHLEITMSSFATTIAVVEPDRTVKAPPGMAVGTKVLVVPMPSMTELLHDTARRARFKATHWAIREAMRVQSGTELISDKDIVTMVRRARQSPRAG
jgi:hypothetical protein